MTFGKMQVEGGFFQIVMPQQQLNRAQVGTGFEQVGGETMAQRVRMNLLRGQTGSLCGVTTGVPDSFGRDGTIRGVAASTRKQPLGGLVFESAPVVAQSVQELGAEHHRDLPPLAPLDANDHSMTVDIADLQAASSARRIPVA